MMLRPAWWKWLAAPVGLVGLWLVGFGLFVTQLPSQVEDRLTHTDAIVVLTGGSERLSTGIGLLDGGLADRLFVTGVHKGVATAEILRVAHMEIPKELVARIELGHSADDTLGNAEETLAWVRANQIHSLRLVTADYHMRRSLWEFHQAMPEIQIIPHPVFPEHTRTGRWGYPMLLAGEYTKYTVAVIRKELKRGEGS